MGYSLQTSSSHWCIRLLFEFSFDLLNITRLTQIHKYTLSSKTTRRVTTGKTAANITLLPWCRLVAFPAGRFSCARAQSHPFHSSCSQQLWLTFSLDIGTIFSDLLGKQSKSGSQGNIKYIRFAVMHLCFSYHISKFILIFKFQCYRDNFKLFFCLFSPRRHRIFICQFTRFPI